MHQPTHSTPDKAPTLNAWQKRWIAAEITSNLDAAWCDLPGPVAQLDPAHDLCKAAAVLEHACDELMAEADNECTLFVAAQLGITREAAEAAMASAEFDRDGHGWTFAHDGRTRHVYSAPNGALTLHTVDADAEGRRTLACEHCDWEGPEGQQDAIDDGTERLVPGALVPYGQCPRCRGLVHAKAGER